MSNRPMSGTGHGPVFRSPEPRAAVVPPDRSRSALPALSPSMLLRVLDETDHGAIVVTGNGRIVHANHLARHQLAGGLIIHNRDGTLAGSDDDSTEKILGAIEAARRGQRQLLSFQQGNQVLDLAILSLSHPLETDEPLVLVQLSKQPASQNQAVSMFARAHDLSPTEESVMLALCGGQEIADIAKAHRVAESTVRSQVKALREKTGCHSIRRLLQWLYTLPPVVKGVQATPAARRSLADCS